LAQPQRDKVSGIYSLRVRVPTKFMAQAKGTVVVLQIGEGLRGVRIGIYPKVYRLIVCAVFPCIGPSHHRY